MTKRVQRTPDDPKWTAQGARRKEVLWITWFCLYLSLYLYPYLHLRMLSGPPRAAKTALGLKKLPIIL